MELNLLPILHIGLFQSDRVFNSFTSLTLDHQQQEETRYRISIIF